MLAGRGAVCALRAAIMLHSLRISFIVLLVGVACGDMSSGSESSATGTESTGASDATSGDTVDLSGTGDTVVTGSESGDPTATSSGSGDPTVTSSGSGDITGGPVEWPPVECGDVTCAMGELCLHPIPSCNLVDEEQCDGDETTSGETGEPGQCWEEASVPPKCAAVPARCEDAVDVKLCIEDYGGLCDFGGDFAAGVLSCTYVLGFCEEGENGYYYCKNCF